ncbi:MAG: hypothetical protein SFV15_12380 [Polyangiaceae bacterium]|nr:hypothetical protein [Polyangiaceae bacterium]
MKEMFRAPPEQRRLVGLLLGALALGSCTRFEQVRDVNWLGDDERVVVGELLIEGTGPVRGALLFASEEDYETGKSAYRLNGLDPAVVQYGGIFSVRAGGEAFYMVGLGSDRASLTRVPRSGGDQGSVSLRIPPGIGSCEYVGTIRLKQLAAVISPTTPYQSVTHYEVDLVDNFEFGSTRIQRGIANCHLVSNVGSLVKNR